MSPRPIEYEQDADGWPLLPTESDSTLVFTVEPSPTVTAIVRTVNDGYSTIIYVKNYNAMCAQFLLVEK